MRSALMPYLLVGVGGFLGANARFVVARLVEGVAATSWFPLGTFLVNVSGSLLLGVLGGALAHRASPDSDAIRLALGMGFLGAYTTFSTLESEAHTLVDSGAWLAAASYAAASLFVGLAALRAGLLIARGWLT